jgi:hypothetical protein
VFDARTSRARCRFQFFGYLHRQHVRIGKICAVFERFVPKPKNVEIYFVPFEQVVVGEAFEPVAFDAFMAVLGVEALDELVDQSVSAFLPSE